jgi:hypothetical protein
VDWRKNLRKRSSHEKYVWYLVEMSHRDEIPSVWRNNKLVLIENVLSDLSHYEEKASAGQSLP